MLTTNLWVEFEGQIEETKVNHIYLPSVIHAPIDLQRRSNNEASRDPVRKGDMLWEFEILCPAGDL